MPMNNSVTDMGGCAPRKSILRDERVIGSGDSGPSAAADKQANRLGETQHRMGQMFTPNQVLGRLQTIGCVAVEITQKCNLDCTLCYLSEHSQSVADIPIEEVFRRLDDVLHHYGPGTVSYTHLTLPTIYSV